jgi:hypothetical protein
MRQWRICWFGGIAFLSAAPLPVKHFLGTTGVFHNSGHFAVFAVSEVMLLADAATSFSRVRRSLFLLAFASATELLEAVLYHNRVERFDLFIDYMGISVSALLLYAGRVLMAR